MRLQIVLGFTVSALAARGASAQVQPPRDSAVSLGGVTVTATRSDASILRTPLAISKVTAADLRAVNGYGIEDALSRIPGVIAQSRYGTSDVRLIIRGFGARRRRSIEFRNVARHSRVARWISRDGA